MHDRSIPELLERWRALERRRDDDLSADERIELDQQVAAAADEYREATAHAEPLSDPVATLGA